MNYYNKNIKEELKHIGFWQKSLRYFNHLYV